MSLEGFYLLQSEHVNRLPLIVLLGLEVLSLKKPKKEGPRMKRTFTLSSVSRSIPSCWQLAEPMSTISDWTSKGPSTKCWKPYLGIKSISRYVTIFYFCLIYLFLIDFFIFLCVEMF